jgi:hypothetical protein
MLFSCFNICAPHYYSDVTYERSLIPLPPLYKLSYAKMLAKTEFKEQKSFFIWEGGWCYHCCCCCYWFAVVVVIFAVAVVRDFLSPHKLTHYNKIIDQTKLTFCFGQEIDISYKLSFFFVEPEFLHWNHFLLTE